MAGVQKDHMLSRCFSTPYCASVVRCWSPLMCRAIEGRRISMARLRGVCGQRAGVEIGLQIAIVAAVVGGDIGKDGLAQQRLERVPAPVLRPLFQECLLPLAEQHESRLVERAAVEVRDPSRGRPGRCRSPHDPVRSSTGGRR